MVDPLDSPAHGIYMYKQSKTMSALGTMALSTLGCMAGFESGSMVFGSLGIMVELWGPYFAKMSQVGSCNAERAQRCMRSSTRVRSGTLIFHQWPSSLTLHRSHHIRKRAEV